MSDQELWESARPSDGRFRGEALAGLPEAARRYLAHAIAAGTPLAGAVRLRMHGEIKLRRWSAFTARQVLVWNRGMIWSADVRMYGLPVRGFDRLVDGNGSMRWALFGILPLITASGPDIARSAAGRFAGEPVWLPSRLCRGDVSWTASDLRHPRVTVSAGGLLTELELAVDAAGRLESLRFSRWGNPGGGRFRYTDFGGLVDENATFGGYTIPTRLRIGWHFGTDRFEREGEFFRVTIDEARYR